MSRWEHTVTVMADTRQIPYLRCLCGWTSDVRWAPTVSLLAQIAQDHRRAANKASTSSDRASSTGTKGDS